MGSSIKQIILSILTAMAGIAAVWIWQDTVPLVAAGDFKSYSAFIVPASSILLAASLFSLAALFVEPPWLLYAGIGMAPAAAFFLMPQSVPIAGALATALLLTLFAGRRIRKEYALSLSFSAGKTLKAGLPIYFTALSLVISLFYYQQIAGRERLPENIIPKAAVSLSLRALEGAFSDLQTIPRTDSLITVDEFLAQNLESQLKSSGIAPPAASKTEIARLVAEQRNELARRYGISMQGGERLADVLHRAITEKVAGLLGPYARFLPFLSALAFFFALRTLSFPLYFIAVAFTALLIAILRSATIIKSEKRSIEVARLTL